MEKLDIHNIISEHEEIACESEPTLSFEIDELTDRQSQLNPKLSRVLERVKVQKDGVTAHTRHSSHHSHGQHNSAMW